MLILTFFDSETCHFQLLRLILTQKHAIFNFSEMNLFIRMPFSTFGNLNFKFDKHATIQFHSTPANLLKTKSYD